MAPPAKRVSTTPKGTAPSERSHQRYKAIRTSMGEHTLYMFFAPASELWQFLAINERVEDKDEGYQRALSPGRVAAIANYMLSGRTIPTTLTLSLDADTLFDEATSELIIPIRPRSGWVIDGQHRLAGAHTASSDGNVINLASIAFIGLSDKEQINQFITINREAKGVPTSLYLDLLGHLTQKSPQDAAKERAVDIGNQLRKDESSPFADRIAVIRPPKAGEISITNFVRKVVPLIIKDKGFLNIYFEREQRQIIDNYFKGLSNVYADEFRRLDVIFFRTTGFGAMMNALPYFFSTCLAQYNGFTVHDVTNAFKKVGPIDFESWRKSGSGNAVELALGDDVRQAVTIAFKSDASVTSGSIRL